MSSEFPTTVLVVTLFVIVFLAWLGWRPRRSPPAPPTRKPGAE